ncbi:hypothetical protein NE172_18150 [Clostridium botulinum]|uniref:Phage gp6-like head-tail connector protein n=1 Tax=Clostridium botulinum TaxID=1491 RepID=A0A6B4JS83_CLOBO|nr:hypothetical protein [Clostridium botulinum]EES50563.1 hypothetical protein CLO_1568 [Clostridium botulinum E1 str. 'BoNT E Beluga']MBY6762839.1 hypothetical protein [Clostridium botulinum]MBY6921623.1 hypothetical protein [Clostridium botulinum]MCR1132825.1 hypothetical protein [Clostridium botulinum]NFH70772.1 hypothetical protein [Clostridium botulinum]
MSYTETELQEMAVLAIFNYFDEKYSKDYIKENFTLALKVLIENIRTSVTKPIGIKSVSQNGTSVTYNEGTGFNAYLTTEVLSLLPKKSNFKVW